MQRGRSPYQAGGVTEAGMTVNEVYDTDGITPVARVATEGELEIYIAEGREQTRYVLAMPEEMTVEELRRAHSLIGQVLATQG